MTTPDARLDKIVGLSREFVNQAGAIALETNDAIDRGAFDYAKWAKSMLNLWDLSLTNTLEIAPDMFTPCLPCPQLPGDEADYSELITVATATTYARKISVVPGTFRHDGAPNFAIKDYLIRFDPDVLPANATQFRISVLWPGLRSGTYRGDVKLAPESGTNVVIEDIMTVIIDL
jgi:hypothetical protein